MKSITWKESNAPRGVFRYLVNICDVITKIEKTLERLGNVKELMDRITVLEEMAGTNTPPVESPEDELARLKEKCLKKDGLPRAKAKQADLDRIDELMQQTMSPLDVTPEPEKEPE